MTCTGRDDISAPINTRVQCGGAVSDRAGLGQNDCMLASSKVSLNPGSLQTKIFRNNAL